MSLIGIKGKQRLVVPAVISFIAAAAMIITIMGPTASVAKAVFRMCGLNQQTSEQMMIERPEVQFLPLDEDDVCGDIAAKGTFQSPNENWPSFLALRAPGSNYLHDVSPIVATGHVGEFNGTMEAEFAGDYELVIVTPKTDIVRDYLEDASRGTSSEGVPAPNSQGEAYYERGPEVTVSCDSGVSSNLADQFGDTRAYQRKTGRLSQPVGRSHPLVIFSDEPAVRNQMATSTAVLPYPFLS